MSYLGTNRGRARLSLKPVSGLLIPKDLVLLAHFDGANNSKSMIDATEKHTIIPALNAVISTAQGKFGQSVRFPAATDYVSVPTTANLNFGAGKWSIDYWVRRDNVAQASRIHFCLNPSSTWYQNAIRIDAGSGNNNKFWIGFGNGVNTWSGTIQSDTLIVAETWHHVALTCDAVKIRLFIDGVQDGEINAVSILDATNGILLGSDFVGSNTAMIGHMDELRISKGIARWTSNFTPPTAPSLPK
jgi:hypothetical protein